MPSPSPGDLPDPGIKHGFLPLQADSLPSEPPANFSPKKYDFMTHFVPQMSFHKYAPIFFFSFFPLSLKPSAVVTSYSVTFPLYVSLIAQLVKNPPAMQETPV